MLLPRRQIHEVLVIGSGASGGWVAKELTERGLTVVMLEAGPPRVPTRDFTEHIWPYQLKFRRKTSNTTRVKTENNTTKVIDPRAVTSTAVIVSHGVRFFATQAGSRCPWH